MFTSNGPLIGPGASLVMHSITSDFGATSGMLNGIGKLVLKLGAQLDLNPLQASGIYTGNYTFSWKETTNPTGYGHCGLIIYIHEQFVCKEVAIYQASTVWEYLCVEILHRTST